LHQVLKRTFIYVTHDQEEAMTLADRIIVMRSGEIIQIGSPMEIYSNPVNYFVADFFGSPSMNLVAGEIMRGADGARFRSTAFEVALPLRFKSARAGAATLGVRPEHVMLGGADGIELPVRLIEPLGGDTLIYFDAAGQRAFIAVSEGLSRTDIPIGAPMTLSFAPDKVYLFDANGRRM
jgi:multiple sugar transport system ATP-binding protein